MIVHECEQGSSEWFELRKGRPTASEFGRILTPKTLESGGAGSQSYINQLVGAMLSLIPEEGIENATSRSIRWGQQTEAEARSYYCLDRGVDVKQVGFITTDDGRFGCSPDGLVGEDDDVDGCGGLELKCPQPATQVGRLLKGTLPDDYKGQVHGALIVTGRSWWDFLSYSPGLPPFLVRTFPDDYTEKLKAALEEFWQRLVKTLDRIKTAG